MHTSKLTKCFTSIVIFQYHLVRWCKLQIHTIGRPSDLSVGVYTQVINMHTGYLHRELTMTHIDFSILSNHVTVIYLRFIKSTNFYVVTQKKIKIAVFFPAICPCI